MKILISSLLLLIIGFTGYSQTPADALRYSFLTGQGGTARNQAIGGAGGSLGGEFSSLFINPAGLGFYKTGDFVVTPIFVSKLNESTYLSNSLNETSNKLSLSATGLVFSTNTPGKRVKNVTVGLGINRKADFNNHIYYYGENYKSSYSEKFLEELVDNQVSDPNDAATGFPFGSSLAFNTFLIDTLSGPGGNLEGYRTLANPATGLSQQMDITTSGGITEAAIGVGVNLEEKWFFGGSLSFPFLRYTRHANYKESDASNEPHNDFNYFEANEMLETKGVGLNAKLGVIYKPKENIQLGLAFHSPTIYRLTDYYNMQIITDVEDYAGGQGALEQNSTDLNDGDLLRTPYNIVTPWRAMLSGTYLFGTSQNVKQQKGFITADVEYVNYKNASFHARSNQSAYKTYFTSLNGVIDDIYSHAINVRVGGEIKLNTFMVRLGGAYYGNPYENEDGGVTKATGGIGYRSGGMFIDLSFAHALKKDFDYPYQLNPDSQRPGINNAANIRTNGNAVALTVGFKL